jgi:hypothetical protein
MLRASSLVADDDTTRCLRRSHLECTTIEGLGSFPHYLMLVFEQLQLLLPV